MRPLCSAGIRRARQGGVRCAQTRVVLGGAGRGAGASVRRAVPGTWWPWARRCATAAATGHLGAGLAEVFDAVQAATGIVVAGARARRTTGPVIAVVEELDRAVPMMRAAERIASATGGDARIWLLEHDRSRQDWIEGQIRLALGTANGPKLEVVDMSVETPHSVAGLMRRAGAKFVIARSAACCAGAGRGPVRRLLDGPLFLVR